MLTIIVALAIVAAFLFERWLDLRQVRYVAAHRSQVPAAFAGRISLADHQKAADYTIAKRRLGMKQDIAGAALSMVLLAGGGFVLLQSAIAATLGTGALGSLALAGALALIFAAISIPFDYVATFSIEERFGFNRSTKALFFADLAKSILLAVAFMTPLVLAIDYAARQVGEAWWIAVWVILVAFNVLALLVVPTFITPLFNKFEPLTDDGLKVRIQALARRCGFRAKGVFKMDGSKRSGHGNAFFTGIGPAKRIVLFDTLLEKLAPEEVEAVLAHEIGHFRLRHIVKRILASLVVSLALLAIAGWLSRQNWFYEGFGLDPAVARDMPLVGPLLFLLLVPLVSTWFRIIPTYVSRVHEFEADAYAASHSNANDLASALVKLQRDNAATLTPDPIYSAINHSHPTIAQRIARLPIPQ
ncbi:MAG TPA: M48 family metallopeptidase [Dongiaceae bacterium]|nr:M48 family metallopeptidase [Dongiaceae bacterium]